jgi:hypothetical protein
MNRLLLAARKAESGNAEAEKGEHGAARRRHGAAGVRHSGLAALSMDTLQGGLVASGIVF